MRTFKNYSCVVAVFILCGNVFAAPNYISGVSIGYVSSEFTGWTYQPAINTINNNGFSPEIGDYGAQNGQADTMWSAASGDNHPVIVWDLGGTYDLDKFYVWSQNYYVSAYGAAVMTFRYVDIYTTTDFNPNTTNWTHYGTQQVYLVLNHPWSDVYETPNIIDMTGTQARLVKMVAYDSWAYKNIGAQECGLSKVRFTGAQVATSPIINGVSVADVSSQFVGWTYSYAISTVDESGFDSVYPPYGAHGAGSTTMWASATGDHTPYIIWDLGDTYMLDRFIVWNHNYPAGNQAAEQGLKNVDIYTTTDTDIATATWTLYKNVNLRRATYPVSEFYNDPDVIGMSGVEARFVKMVGHSSYIYSWSGQEAGLSEVKFTGNALNRTPQIKGVKVASVSTEDIEYGKRYGSQTSNSSGFDSVALKHDNEPSHMWQSTGMDAVPTMVWDLGKVYDLDAVGVWNYNADAEQGQAWKGMQGINLYVSTDSDLSTATWQQVVLSTEYYQKQLKFAKGTAGYCNYDRIYLDGVDARFVKLEASDYASAGKGLSEVLFFGSTPIDGVTVAQVSSAVSSSPAINTINQSGFNQLARLHDNAQNTSWQSLSGDFSPYIIWDLQKVYDLEVLRAWNLNVAGLVNYGVNDANVYVSTDASVSSASWKFVKKIKLHQATGSSGYKTLDMINLEGSEARFVKLQIISSYNGPDFAPAGSGLSEVQFGGREHLNGINGVELADYTSENTSTQSYAINTINKSGFDETSGRHSSTLNSSWVSSEGSDLAPYIVWDLGPECNLDAIKVWNCNIAGSSMYGIRDLEIYVSGDSDPETAAWNLVESTNLDIASEEYGYTGFDYIYFDHVATRLVKFKPTNNYYIYNGGGFNGSKGVGLSEVEFYGTQNNYMLPDCRVSGIYLKGDLNSDCYVNMHDLVIFVQDWLK